MGLLSRMIGILFCFIQGLLCEVDCADHPCAGAMLYSHFSIDMNDCADPSLRTGPCCTHTLKKTCLCGASFLRHTDIKKKKQAIYIHIYIYTYIYVNVQG